jgi:hypothetical protein
MGELTRVVPAAGVETPAELTEKPEPYAVPAVCAISGDVEAPAADVVPVATVVHSRFGNKVEPLAPKFTVLASWHWVQSRSTPG